jgi:hypothetical protein
MHIIYIEVKHGTAGVCLVFLTTWLFLLGSSAVEMHCCVYQQWLVNVCLKSNWTPSHWWLQQLIDHLDRDLHYAIVEEGKMGFDSVTNYDDVKDEIKHKVVPLLLSFLFSFLYIVKHVLFLPTVKRKKVLILLTIIWVHWIRCCFAIVFYLFFLVPSSDSLTEWVLANNFCVSLRSCAIHPIEKRSQLFITWMLLPCIQISFSPTASRCVWIPFPLTALCYTFSHACLETCQMQSPMFKPSKSS